MVGNYLKHAAGPDLKIIFKKKKVNNTCVIDEKVAVIRN